LTVGIQVFLKYIYFIIVLLEKMLS